jgi:hypothetical protein
MLEQFRDYFNAIEMPNALIERAEQICGAFDPFIERPVHGVFVCDFFEPEGARRYTSLFLCTRWHLIELKNFVVAQNIDLTRLLDVVYLDIARNDLADLNQPAQGTTMRVEVRFKSAMLHAILAAARNNCDFLHQFTARHLIPRASFPPRV